MKRQINIFTNIDWVTVGIFLSLLFIGWINIYSANFDEEYLNIFDFGRESGKQFIWIGTSLFLGIILLIIDAKFYQSIAYTVYVVLMVILLVVLLFGIEKNGARSWFKIGDFLIQPAEFAKFATCMALSRFICDYGISLKNIKNIMIAGAILLFPVLLIILQNDTGSALVYSSFIIILYREKLSGIILVIGLWIIFLFIISVLILNDKLYISLDLLIPILLFVFVTIYGIIFKNRNYIIIVCAIYAASLGTFYISNELFDTQITTFMILLLSLVITAIPCVIWAFRQKIHSIYLFLVALCLSLSFSYSVEYIYNNVIGNHQRIRINVLLGILEDRLGAGYNVYQSKIAIGSGGMWGKGFLNGTQTKFDYVPEPSTDFIFCTIAEEWGFVGSTLLVGLFVALIIRIILLAEKQRDKFARLYGYGLASILLFHFIVNIGMTIGIIPIIGIPLPFVSYGGSSLWSFTVLLFIFVKLASSKKENFKTEWL